MVPTNSFWLSISLTLAAYCFRTLICLNRWTTHRALLRTRLEIVSWAIFLRSTLDLRRKTSLIFLEGSYSYNFDYIRDFSDFRKGCKLLKINGRGERI